jgi:hypothetical protein
MTADAHGQPRHAYPIRLWRGELGLAKTFWLFGVLGWPLVVVACFLMDIQFMLSFAGDAPSVARTAIVNAVLVMAVEIYPLVISIAIWRSAQRRETSQALGILARATALAVMAYLALELIANLYRLAMHPGAWRDPMLWWQPFGLWHL